MRLHALRSLARWAPWFLLTTLALLALTQWLLGLPGVTERSDELSAFVPTLVLTLLLRALSVRLPRGDVVRPDAYAVFYGLCVHGIRVTAAVIVVSGVITAFYDRPPQTTRRLVFASGILDILRRVSVAIAVSPFVAAGGVPGSERELLVVMAAGVLYAILDDLSWVAQSLALHRQQEAHSESFLSMLQPLAAVNIVHVSIAGVALRVHEMLGLGGLLIGLILVVLLQVGLASYYAMRRAYAETIGALARASELDRPEEVGHVERVAELVVSVGRAIGMRGRELETLRFAALLHEIGRIGVDYISEREAAERGAQIVAQVDRLRQAAPLIEYQGFEAFPETAVPLGAVIIGVCCAFARAEKDLGRDSAMSLLRERWQDHAAATRVLALVDSAV